MFSKTSIESDPFVAKPPRFPTYQTRADQTSGHENRASSWAEIFGISRNISHNIQWNNMESYPAISFKIHKNTGKLRASNFDLQVA